MFFFPMVYLYTLLAGTVALLQQGQMLLVLIVLLLFQLLQFS